LRLIDFCITQLKAQGPYRTCNESKEEEEDFTEIVFRVEGFPSITPLETVITSDSVSFDPTSFSFQKSANGGAPAVVSVSPS
jgi:hypothetical protein